MDAQHEDERNELDDGKGGPSRSQKVRSEGDFLPLFRKDRAVGEGSLFWEEFKISRADLVAQSWEQLCLLELGCVWS